MALCRPIRFVGGRGSLSGGGFANPGDDLGDRIACPGHRLGGGFSCDCDPLGHGLARFGHGLGDGAARTRDGLACACDPLRHGLSRLGHGLGDRLACSSHGLACACDGVRCCCLRAHDLLAHLFAHDLAQLGAGQFGHDNKLTG